MLGRTGNKVVNSRIVARVGSSKLPAGKIEARLKWNIGRERVKS